MLAATTGNLGENSRAASSRGSASPITFCQQRTRALSHARRASPAGDVAPSGQRDRPREIGARTMRKRQARHQKIASKSRRRRHAGRAVSTKRLHINQHTTVKELEAELAAYERQLAKKKKTMSDYSYQNRSALARQVSDARGQRAAAAYHRLLDGRNVPGDVKLAGSLWADRHLYRVK
jgi:hypothetical protein